MRQATKRLAIGAVLGAVLLIGCGEDEDEPEPTAQDAVCEHRADLSDAVGAVSDDVAAGNFGDARDGLADVQTSYDELRSAVGDLGAEEREAIEPQVDALSTDIAALQDVRSLEQLSTAIGTIVTGAEAIATDIKTSLSCD